MEITHTVHGIHFHREGTCNQCPGIHPPPCGCGDCPHLAVVDDLNVCLIHNNQDRYCDVCGVHHGVCERFPDHPWLHVIKDSVCGYKFIRVDSGGNEDDTPLPFTEKKKTATKDWENGNNAR